MAAKGTDDGPKGVEAGGSGAFYGSQGETWVDHPAVKPDLMSQLDMKGKVSAVSQLNHMNPVALITARWHDRESRSTQPTACS
jgi:hypothetical protein